MNKIIVFCFYLTLLSSNIAGQNCQDILWHKDKKITIENFCIKVNHTSNSPCFAQFSVNYSTPGLGFFSNNFNKKIENKMICSASWIDTTFNSIPQLIRYQQILFDLSEIYSRKFRKELLINKNKIALGNNLVERINTEIMKSFSIKRAEFEYELDNEKGNEVKLRWELWIGTEINTLKEFDYDNEKKIKLKK